MRGCGGTSRCRRAVLGHGDPESGGPAVSGCSGAAAPRGLSRAGMSPACPPPAPGPGRNGGQDGLSITAGCWPLGCGVPGQPPAPGCVSRSRRRGSAAPGHLPPPRCRLFPRSRQASILVGTSVKNTRRSHTGSAAAAELPSRLGGRRRACQRRGRRGRGRQPRGIAPNPGSAPAAGDGQHRPAPRRWLQGQDPSRSLGAACPGSGAAASCRPGSGILSIQVSLRRAAHNYWVASFR